MRLLLRLFILTIVIFSSKIAFTQCCGDGICDSTETPINCPYDCAGSSFNCPNTIGSFFSSPSWPVNLSAAQSNNWCYTLSPPYPAQVCFEYRVPNVGDSASVSFSISACGGTTVNQANFPPIGGCNNAGYSSSAITSVSTYNNTCGLISNSITTGGPGCYTPGDIITICLDINSTTTCPQITICPVIACGQTNCATTNTTVGCPSFNFTDSTYISPCDSMSGYAVVTPNCGSHFTYLWDDPLTQTDSFAIGLTPGTYSVIITNTAFNCDTTITVVVPSTSIAPSISVSSPDTFCANENIILNANSSSGTITWYNNFLGTTIIGIGSPLVLNNPGTGNHLYYVNSIDTCNSEMDSVLIVVNGVNAIINATPTSGLIPLSVFFGNGSSTGLGISYYWNFGDGDTSTQFQPTHTYTSTGNYIVTLIVSDGICSDTTSILIDAFDDSVIIIPNVFTPNGDGFNDLFAVDGINLIAINAEIYNRWGQILYTWNTVKGGWDGKTTSGENSPDGTYFYLIKITDHNNEEHLKKGSFSLIR